MHLLIFGLGYTGAALARAAAGTGINVTVATRQSSPAGLSGVNLVPFGTPPLEVATHVVATAAPDAGGDPVLASHAKAIASANRLRWIGYLSTTGVYGDQGGSWVDEDTPPRPSSERGARRVAAEQAWQGAHPVAALDCFRLAGIYGPGRSVLDDLRAGQARRVIKPGHQFGRIHRDDIVGALLAAMAQDRPRGCRVLNGADDEPAESADVIAEGARLLGLALPPAVPFDQAAAGMSAMAKSFWADNRKVRSALTQSTLGRSWRYPTYRQGLRAILSAEQGQQGSP